MRKYFVLISALLFVQCSSSKISELYKTYNSENYLYWSEERKLSWTDFQGMPIETSKMGCESFFYNPSTAERENLFSSTELSAICVFDKSKSWVNREFITDNLLLYNQVMFDIYELHTRILRKEFKETEIGLSNLSEEFHRIYEENNRALIDEIQQFRRESKLGKEESVVIDWSTNINNKINDLKEFRIIYIH